MKEAAVPAALAVEAAAPVALDLEAALAEMKEVADKIKALDSTLDEMSQ